MASKLQIMTKALYKGYGFCRKGRALAHMHGAQNFILEAGMAS